MGIASAITVQRRAVRVAVAVLVLSWLAAYAAAARAELPDELERRVTSIVAETRRVCDEGGDLTAVGPRIRALARDRQARAFMFRHYRKDFDVFAPYKILLVAMAYDWQRGDFDGALATAEAWQSDGSELSYGLLLLDRILEHRAIAARGVTPPEPGWATARRIEKVELDGMKDALVVAWNRPECPLNGPPSRKMLVALYVPEAGSDNLRQVGAAAEADLPNSIEYGDRFFEAVTFPERDRVRHSYIIARYGIAPNWTAAPESIELLSADDTGLHPVEVEDGDVLHDLRDLGRDGRYEAISYDRRWDSGHCTIPLMDRIEAGNGKGQRTCVGGYEDVAIVLDWRDGRLVEACRDFPGYYDELIAAFQAGRELPAQLLNEKETVFQRRMSDAFALFAATMQQGRIGDALASFDLTADAPVLTDDERKRARNAARYLRLQVDRQRAALDRPCPMSGLVLE